MARVIVQAFFVYGSIIHIIGHAKIDAIGESYLNSAPAVVRRDNLNPESWGRLSEFVLIVSRYQANIGYTNACGRNLYTLLNQYCMFVLLFTIA